MTTPAPPAVDAAAFLAGGGETGALIAAHDWSATPLGPIAGWPACLRTAAAVVLRSPVAMVMLWGDAGVMLYNDAYSQFAGGRHPRLLGSNVREGWPEVADFNDHVMRVGLAGGTLRYRDQELVLHRHGVPERVWMDLDYSPVLDDGGRPAGVLAIVTETTARTTAERERASAEAALRTERDRARSVLDSMDEGYALLDAEFRILELNAAGLRLDSRPPADIIGRTHWEAYPGTEQSELGALLRRTMQARAPTRLEHRYDWGDGRQAWLEMRAVPAADGIAIFFRDISERKADEEALRASRAELLLSAESLRLATEASEVGIWDLDLETGTLAWSDRTRAVFGISPDAPCSLDDFYAGLHPDDRAATSAAFAAALDPVVRGTYDVEYRTVGKEDGVIRHVAAKGKALFDPRGVCVRALGTALDITQRKRVETRRAALVTLGDRIRDIDEPAELAFAAAELLGRTLGVDRAGYGTIDKRAETITIERDWNAAGVQSLAGVLHFRDYGSYIDDLNAGRTVVIPDARLDARTLATAAALEAIDAASFVNMPVTESGGLVALLYLNHGMPREWPADELAFIRDVAERTRAATARRQAEHELRTLNASLEQQVAERSAALDRVWTHSRDLAIVIGADGIFRSVNPAWTRILGQEPREVVGRSFLEFVWPEDVDHTKHGLDAAVGQSDLRDFENRYTHRDGTPRWISWRTTTDGDLVYAYGRDVTAEKAQAEALAVMQEALRQSQKMEAVGQLTGGIAHDFNNMLAVVIGSLDLLTRRLGQSDSRASRHVEAARDASRRAALLTQRLLAFSRQQPLKPEAIDVGKLVIGMSELIRGSLRADIRLETVLTGGAWRTYADPNQLENVLLNLAVNARDAMPDGGKLTLETQNAHLDERYAAANLGVPAGQYVLIAATDTGSGMSAEVMAKAFDPFFTTKEVGKGTGLGLSQVYGFVKQSGGHVKIYSELGKGTTVRVYLPRLLGAESDGGGEVRTDVRPLGEHEEVVLVVEDQTAVRQFSVDALTELGYRVLEADSAAAALALLEAHPEIALLFTDVVMPDTNGARLADEATRRWPRLKVLFTTGYTRNAMVHNGVFDADVNMIGKPFTLDELAAKVREVLETDIGGAPG